jgi:hypothetical protein
VVVVEIAERPEAQGVERAAPAVAVVVVTVLVGKSMELLAQQTLEAVEVEQHI